MIPTIFGFLVVIIGLLLSNLGTLQLTIICTLLGATAALIVVPLGGAPVNPALLALVFVVWHVVKSQGPAAIFKPLSLNLPGFWLGLFLVWAVISAFVNPRLFDGDVFVFVVDRFVGQVTPNPVPVGPVSTNITQSVYAITGVICYGSFVAMLKYEESSRRVLDAMLWTGGLHALAGILTLLQWAIGFPDILSIFKNSNYVFLGGEVGGLVRITGTFAEASSYAAIALVLMGFAQALFLTGYRPRVSGLIAATLLVLLLLSTSSTAYGALAISGTIAFFFAGIKLVYSPAYSPFKKYLYLPVLGIFLALVVALFFPSIISVLLDFFDVVVGSKLQSQSGIERSSWNKQAFQNAFDTYLLGTGLGSNHASSWPLVILSNLGWPGALSFILFYWCIFRSSNDKIGTVKYQLVTAAKCALVVHFSGAILAARVFDPGLLFFIIAALSVSGQVNNDSVLDK